MNYLYLSDGTKLSALDGNGEGLVYRGPFVYRKSSGGNAGSSLTLESAAFGGGRLTPTGAMLYVTDYLGSGRAVVNGKTGKGSRKEWRQNKRLIKEKIASLKTIESAFNNNSALVNLLNEQIGVIKQILATMKTNIVVKLDFKLIHQLKLRLYIGILIMLWRVAMVYGGLRQQHSLTKQGMPHDMMRQ